MATPEKPRLGLGTRLIYGFGSVAYGVKDQALSSLLLLFYNQVVGLPAAWVGAALGFALVLDALADPVIGQMSDRLRSPLGRRHPFLYASALPVALAFLALWNPPIGWSKPALLAWLVGSVLVVRTFITLYEIPSAALAPEFTEDYDKRTSLLSYRFFFGWMGGIGMTMLAYQHFLAPSKAHPLGIFDRSGYAAYALTAALIMAAAILVSAAGTHRWIPFLPKPRTIARRPLRAVLREMGQTLAHRSFLVILTSGLFSSMGFGLTQALSVYFGTYFWEFKPQQLTALVGAGALGTVVALMAAPLMSRLMGKKLGAMVLFAFSFVISTGPMILRLSGLFPPNGSPALLITLSLTGLFGTAAFIVSSILSASMVADVVEDSELRTGRRSEGLFFSASSLGQKAVTGLGIFASSLVLQLARFPADARPGAVPADVLHSLALIYVPTLVGLNLVALVIVSFYRISRETHAANLRQLAETAAAGASEGAPEPIRLGG
jgi:Na+/melibiose symporter-like transporter